MIGTEKSRNPAARKPVPRARIVIARHVARVKKIKLFRCRKRHFPTNDPVQKATPRREMPHKSHSLQKGREGCKCKYTNGKYSPGEKGLGR